MTRFLIAFAFATTGTAYAGIVAYEGDVFPESTGWTRLGTFDAERWLDGGVFSQRVDLGVWVPGPIGETDVYRTPLADFSGVDAFFVEWRVETDAPGSILDVSGTPVVVSAFGNIANYHVSITNDRVLFNRSNFLPLVYVNIEPGMPHAYRLELFGDTSYSLSLNGRIVDAGIPEGRFTNPESFVLWGVQRHTFDATTHWDYIRFGAIPQDGSGDYDSDGSVTAHDFYFFHECLTNRRPGVNGGPGYDAGPGCRFADFDFDGDTDLRDFADFQNRFAQSL